ncbi:hypothetical protein EBA05_22300 [Xanthomonas oryzae pv. oryzae]|nr:hypothetical protein C0L90_22250 [Xanthomonas oryzae pv. oryzae]QBI17693.1 hypothetical protein EYR03_22555 [Xanthomonas oryzae pv. oryzae]QBN26500.1 hypothetical protein EBA00_21905 [Xanthomonas oryzae pv. oryzae]QBN37342.1 hypothetical protein EBA03_22010 [Xanthomonas oryzae pv. oryzae]QBN40999.1 hypothetical protein EBA04_22470 [Xanthomonas oryzae pv. oryzae]
MPPHSEQIVSRICGALFRGSLVGGLMYVSTATRRILVEPIIKSLAAALDDWSEEGRIAAELTHKSVN